MPSPMPGELTHEESLSFIESLTDFGRPYPVLILTGGDVLMRDDIVALAAHARTLGIPVAIAPSVTPRLTPDALDELRALGVRIASVSLDGSTAETHEGLRGIHGHFAKTVEAIDLLRRHGYAVQVNTVVTRENVEQLPEIAAIVQRSGAAVWEVFFLIKTGRGTGLDELDPEENEDVCNFLFDASQHGFIVRTVEAPFFRRIVATRREGRIGPTGPLYRRLASRAERLLGPAEPRIKAQTKGTRDGKGIVFVSHDGEVFPAGFLPIGLGNIRTQGIGDIYRDSPLLRDIRAACFTGRCGACEYRDLCGGSRARAYAVSGDPLGEDPACAYQPAASGRT